MSTAVLTTNTNNKMAPGKQKRSDASLFSSPRGTIMTKKDTSAAVSPDHLHHDTPKEKSKIKHAAMLLPEQLEHAAATKIKHASQLVPTESASTKKRSVSEDAAALVTPPPSKRRRSDANVSIQRTPLKKDVKKIPEPPTEDPPEPTKYLKVLLLGPADQGKQEWVQGLNPSIPAPAAASKSSTRTNTFTVDYYSKDYSFEASSDVQETVRLQMYSVDCDATKAPPATWTHSLVPSMQHVVLVLDLFVAQDAKETLRTWKTWLERHVTGKTNAGIPVSLLLVHSGKEAATVPASDWFKLGATVEKLCRYWHINKWYMMEHQETSSDIILQTMIERTWSVMGLLPEAATEEPKEAVTTPEKAAGKSVTNAVEISDD